MTCSCLRLDCREIVRSLIHSFLAIALGWLATLFVTMMRFAMEDIPFIHALGFSMFAGIYALPLWLFIVFPAYLWVIPLAKHRQRISASVVMGATIGILFPVGLMYLLNPNSIQQLAPNLTLTGVTFGAFSGLFVALLYNRTHPPL